ncbi:MAG: TonB-dependent receptor [Verrucomicrobia bacterium]|nr:TonB-dependent receptor [Verrucomicrobiota bacterium]
MGDITGRVQSAASGQRLNNARVAVQGTNLFALTDESGLYRFVNVPAGRAALVVTYTGLDSQTIPVEVAGDRVTEQDVQLTSSSGVIEMDKFVVAYSREMAAHALAINEQRHAPNIKNVLAADAHGDVTEGNVAEFMKFMPGVVIGYGDQSANTVAVRGLGANLTGVSVDGATMAHANLNGNDRTFQFKQVDINSVSRIELTKVPTPSTPADTLGGSVNLISKSSFDRSQAEFRWRTFFSINSEDFNLRRTPFPYENYVYKAVPGFDVSYSKPFNEKFGIVLSASSNIQYNVQDYTQTTWNQAGTSTGATQANPYLQQVNVIDAPKFYTRQSANLQADWRVTPNSVLSFGVKGFYYKDDNGNYNWTASAGTVGTPLPATGIPMTFGPTFTNGATGRGAVTMSGGQGRIHGTLLSENLRYRFDNGTWRISANAAYSESTTSNTGAQNGHFNALAVSLKQPARVVFTDIKTNRPDGIKVYDNSNREIDIFDINNYQITEANFGTMRDIRDQMKNADVNVRRAFSFFSMPSSVQMGGAQRTQTRNRRSPTQTYTYNGPGGDLSAAPFAAKVYTIPAPFNYGRIPWVSPKYAFAAWVQNPSLFTVTPAQLVANTTSQISTSEWIEETVSALYLQPEVRLFNNRLHVMTGVRYEKTTDEGLGPLVDPGAVWVRNANGTFAHAANGSRIRKPEAGAVGSIEELFLTRKERGFRAERSYDGYYPSLHFTYNAMENLLVRLAYANTYGRPNFSEVIPNTTITERDVLPTDPNQSPGSISVRNTGLQPWTAKNYDLSLEYYSNRGGVFSVGVFRKQIEDFFGSASRVATAADIAALDLDPSFVGWTLNTKFNVGDARISGIEFNLRHSLGFLGAWGNHVQTFVNGTKLKLEAAQGADFSGYVPETANWGFTVAFMPVTLMAQWNHRGQTGRTAAPGPTVSTYDRARTTLDLNLDYQFSPRLSFFANARNITNVYHSTLVYGPDTPDYARQRNVRNYGIQCGIGVKGSF